MTAIDFFLEWSAQIQIQLVELIPDGLAVPRWRTRPAPIHIGRSVGLRKTIVALGCGGLDNCAKHFEVNHDGNDVAAAAGFY